MVRAQLEHLPAAGVQVVEDPSAADVLASHILMPPTWIKAHPGKPMVAMVHGLYWAEYQWQNWALKANEGVMEAIKVADVVTAPTEWVANSIRRHTNRRVVVIPHGVDCDEFTPAEEWQPYVLWDKTRVDPVCDPEPVNVLAERMPGQAFVTTFGDARKNVTVTGLVPYVDSRALTRHAGVYLATSKETFGVATLQAMAAGVPVVGWDWGGTAEIVTHGHDGLLVRPGDHDLLQASIEAALEHRAELGANARETAKRYTWQAACKQYAEVFEEAIARRNTPVRTSIVVTAYNLEKYLPAALDSVAAQTDQDWECIVVDDASPDSCGEIAEGYALRDSRFRVIHNRSNQHQAGARNTGIAAARGRYILPLDADDMLHPTAVSTLASSLDSNRHIDVAYGRVYFVDEEAQPIDYGHGPGRSLWPKQFSTEGQLSYIKDRTGNDTTQGQNHLPYSSMFRRSVWEGIGGYRTRLRNGDDADFWARACSYGFTPRLVTDQDTLAYRVREGSLSKANVYTDWLAWLPWVRDRALLPGGAGDVGTLHSASQGIPSLDPPVAAVIIPVGPGHGRYVQHAVDSVEAQRDPRWECIVVNDSGEPLPPLPAWVKVHETPNPGSGVAAARNVGIRASIARSFLPLDADDLLEPNALSSMLNARDEGQVIYCDFWEDPEVPGEWRIYQTPDYDPRLLITKGIPWAVTCLVRKVDWEKAGGYDEALSHWEDWAFALALAEQGVCSRRVALPLLRYRKHTGRRRELNASQMDAGKAAIRERFGRYWEGEELMACKSCGSRSTRTVAPGGVNATQTMQSLSQQMNEPLVMLRYTGPQRGAQTFRGPSGKTYRFAGGDEKYVLQRDADVLLRNTLFAQVNTGPETMDAVPDEPLLPLAVEASMPETLEPEDATLAPTPEVAGEAPKVTKPRTRAKRTAV